MTNAELVQYYVNLLIAQYRNKSKAKDTVKAFIEDVVSDQIFRQVGDGFDLETAIGDQLTTIGLYRNAPRTIFGLPLDKDFFSIPSYDVDPSAYFGFGDYDTDPVPSWYFAAYADLANVVYYLDDGLLRQLIQYLADINSSDYSLGKIDEILFKYFSDYVTLDDNLDMTITYTNDAGNPSALFDIVDRIGALPHPSGVQVIVT